MSFFSLSGGRINAVSERFIYRAIFCISEEESNFASGKTTAGLPVKGFLVKASAWRKGRVEEEDSIERRDNGQAI